MCKRAYLIVRKHANLFINLLNMMLCTGLLAAAQLLQFFVPTRHHVGIPELTSHEDVFYLRETLCLNMTEEEAAEAFMTEVSPQCCPGDASG